MFNGEIQQIQRRFWVKFSKYFYCGKPLRQVMPELVADRTTGRSIVFATDTYEYRGNFYRADQPMIPLLTLSMIFEEILLPRVQKTKEQQQSRTKARAEVFTPRKVVTQMLDYLEQENPGCFDDPDATFIDPYMKSGLYITEIVKRLYNSEKFKEIFPDSEERLDWIFKTNVFGLAPTEIIYRIATNYIFGFMQKHDVHIQTDHFRMFDALPAAQDGTLSEKLTELFG